MSTERGGLPELAGAPRRGGHPRLTGWLPVAVFVASAGALVALEWARGGSLRLHAVGAGDEVHAYLDANRNSARLLRPHARGVATDDDGTRCEVTLTEGALDAAVEPVPPQLVASAGLAHGTPLRLRLAEGCRFGEGQVIRVELPAVSARLRP